jgi:non-ribosomal peptide synthetase component F
MVIAAQQNTELLGCLERATDHGGRLTVVDRDGRIETVSFAELWESSAAVAGELRQLSWSPVGELRQLSETPATIGAVLGASMGCARTIVGVLRAGMQLASLPTRARAMRPEQHAEQLRTLCGLTGVAALAADAATLAGLNQLSLPLLDYEALGSRGSGCETVGGGKLVQFTSGSTSQPKGIQLSTERIGWHVQTLVAWFGLTPEDSVCAWLPLSHDMGLVGAFLTSWAAGASLTLIDPHVFVRDPGVWMRTCAETESALTWGPNFGYALAARTARHLGEVSLDALRVCVVGAEPVQADTLRAFTDAMAPLGFRGQALTPGYGLAEATLGVSTKPIVEDWRSARVDARALGEGLWWSDADGTEIVSVGRPITGIDVRIAAGAGPVGDIQVKSPSLLEAYLGAELELIDGEWLSTGDLGAIVDGELYVCGRTDDLLIVAGRNLYARDLELVATEHAAVREGTCVAAQSQGGRYVIVAEPRLGSNRDQLHDAARWIQHELTTRFGAAPADVAIIAPRTLPKTPSGKLARRATAELYETGRLERVV